MGRLSFVFRSERIILGVGPEQNMLKSALVIRPLTEGVIATPALPTLVFY